MMDQNVIFNVKILLQQNRREKTAQATREKKWKEFTRFLS